ncbi:protoheme IX farnesyltransferase [bacterium]|nr:protoheme IX farnesyltransferase [bacterium]
MKKEAKWSDWLELTKPRITLLVLATTGPAYLLASSLSERSTPLIGWTLLGTALASGSSSVLNNLADRKRDALMDRTKDRPLASGRISPGAAWVWGLFLGFLGMGILGMMTTPLAALLAGGAILYYWGLYTMWLKRTTPHCTVLGGVAGAIGPLIGWAAATGEIGTPAWALFLLLVIWQPGHFWVFSLLAKEDYKKAGFPMLPVVSGEKTTKRAIVIYGVLFFLGGVTYPLVSGANTGSIYGLAAWIAGGYYLWKTVRFAQQSVTKERALRLFGTSVTTLFLLFGALTFEGIT